MTRFDTDTALEPVGEGVYEGRIDPGWFVFVGPNGGYVAAIVLRAMTRAVGDAERVARSERSTLSTATSKKHLSQSNRGHETS